MTTAIAVALVAPIHVSADQGACGPRVPGTKIAKASTIASFIESLWNGRLIVRLGCHSCWDRGERMSWRGHANDTRNGHKGRTEWGSAGKAAGGCGVGACRVRRAGLGHCRHRERRLCPGRGRVCGLVEPGSGCQAESDAVSGNDDGFPRLDGCRWGLAPSGDDSLAGQSGCAGLGGPPSSGC